MVDEYAEFRDAPGENFKAVLRTLADEYLAAEEQVTAAEEALVKAQATLNDIASVRIPVVTEGMDGKFDLGDGRELELKETLRASVAGEKLGPAVKWLDDHDYGHIVKRQVIVEFGKGEQERATALHKAILDLQANMGTMVIKSKQAIHNATLVSFLNEQLKEGVEMPIDTFGIFRQRVAKVKEL